VKFSLKQTDIMNQIKQQKYFIFHPSIFYELINRMFDLSSPLLLSCVILACFSEDYEDEAGRAAKGFHLRPARGDAEAEGHETPEGERIPEEEAGKHGAGLLMKTEALGSAGVSISSVL
jgi:hypothetical protein